MKSCFCEDLLFGVGLGRRENLRVLFFSCFNDICFHVLLGVLFGWSFTSFFLLIIIVVCVCVCMCVCVTLSPSHSLLFILVFLFIHLLGGGECCSFIMGRGPKKHMKRLTAPKQWMLDKLTGRYVSISFIFSLDTCVRVCVPLLPFFNPHFNRR